MSAFFQSRMFIVICLLFLAGVLRFYRLGEWSPHFDELASFQEDASLFGTDISQPDSQTYRLPRVVPLGYLIMHIGYELFGRDDHGSRIIMAIFGTATVGMVFLFLDYLQGRVAATATSILIALWPEHIYYSQANRFYAIAVFFSFACLLFGAYTLQRRSTLYAVMTCLAGIAAYLSQTLTGVVLIYVFCGLLAGAFVGNKQLSKNILLTFLITGIFTTVFFVFHLWPLLHGWNKDTPEGYTVLQSVKACVGMIGVPVVILGVIGGIIFLKQRNEQNWYWLICALGCGIAILVYPILIMHYHPAYIFPVTISFFVLAGYTIGMVCELLARTSLPAAGIWLVTASLLDPRTLISYYADGSTPNCSRYPVRDAIYYVETNWRKGDRIATFGAGSFNHYAPNCQPVFPLSTTMPIPRLEELLNSNTGRLWIVIYFDSRGLDENFRDWLGFHCSHRLKIQKFRLDHDYRTVQVFLHVPPQYHINK